MRARHVRKPSARPGPLHACIYHLRLGCMGEAQTAEAAKQRATAFAKMLEERVEAELQIKHMWRQLMGEMPGVQAEIAKVPY